MSTPGRPRPSYGCSVPWWSRPLSASSARGVTLAVLGPGRGAVLGLHKASFVVWLVAMSAHVLAHALRIPGLVAPDVRGGEGLGGSRARLTLVSGAIVAGAIVAVATLPLIGPWTSWNGGH